MLFINRAKAYEKTLVNSEKNKKIACQEMLKRIRGLIKYSIKSGEFCTQLFIRDSEESKLVPELEQLLLKQGYNIKKTYYQDDVEISISWDKE